jgi:DNA-binding NarL/FixJ family response regulator
MVRGRKTSVVIHLNSDDRTALQKLQRSPAIRAGRTRRSRIILLLANGVPVSAIARTLGISRRQVYKWAKRFLTEGVGGLADKPGRGRRRPPPQVT